MIIGFCGPIGAGKTTAALYLAERRGFARIRFAGPLKAMMAALGLSAREIDGALKEVPCELLGGKTPRYAMQTIGTEWGRNLIHPDLWISAWRHACRDHPNIVADDVRFANEAATIHAMGGFVYRIVRASTVAASDAHASEQQIFRTDGDIFNNGTIADFEREVAYAVRP